MITDEDAKQLYQHAKSILDVYGHDRVLANQLYRGSRGPRHWPNNNPAACKRHMTVFNEFNVIPKFCFDCYKVVVEPRDVLELFKLVVLYEKHELPNDNVRKCMAEGREQVSGTYKGYIYCLGINEGKEILKTFEKLVSQEISNKIPVTLKRGCSEYGLAYPDYSQTRQGMAKMGYKNEWQVFEDIVDMKYAFHARPVTRDAPRQSGYSLRDAEAMFSWLRYAATIGDTSYLKISDCILQPYENVKRNRD